MLELRLWKTHAADDELQAANEDYHLHRALMASVAGKEPREPSLAARPRDDEYNLSLHTIVRLAFML